MNITPYNDLEAKRLQKNLTQTQKKNNNMTREGVIVNSLVKDANFSIAETRDNLIISDNIALPEKLKEQELNKNKSLLPISAITVGIMGTIASVSYFIKKTTNANLSDIPVEKKLPSLTRNISVNDELHQAIYRMIQAPSKKTMLAGIGVMALTATAFMGKIFLDGFKDVWVKKKSADIEKNLQENLIEVETQSFAGKMQIIRNMLSSRAKEFDDILGQKYEKTSAFEGFKLKRKNIAFTQTHKTKNENKTKENLKYIATGVATFASIIALAYISIKNLRQSSANIKEFINKKKNILNEFAPLAKTEEDKNILESLLQIVGADKNLIKEITDKTTWEVAEKESFIEKVYSNITRSSAKVNSAIGGDGIDKPAFYSHVNDYRAFFYNWMLDNSNKQFKQLFFGITGLSALSYGGKIMGEAIKEVQVQKLNKDTELNLQKRLVSTELRNFKAKKDAAINPLIEEFYNQRQKGKPNSELKIMADNILFEIKNGAPFVYS